MFIDPIEKEVRRIRHEIETECDNDMEKIYAKFLNTQKTYNFRFITSPFSKKENKHTNISYKIEGR